MNVDHVEYGAVDFPSCPQESLSRPFTLRKKVLRKFGLFFGCNSLNIARMHAFTLDAFPFVRQKVPYFDRAY